MRADVIQLEKEKLDQTRARLEKRQKLIHTKMRKGRLKGMIELGGLVAKAGLENFDPVVLFGAFLEIKEAATNEKALKRWAEKREAWLKMNEARRLIVKLLSEPATEASNLLKGKKFRWNTFRKEWYGFGKKEEIEMSLGKSNAEVTEVTD